jgi:hypothetical protein
MPFEKGQSGNPAGRPKGAKDKATQELRDWVKSFLEGKTKDLEREWKELKPEQKFALFEKLLAYTLPKPQTIDLNLDFERLSEEQLDQIIERIIGQ